VAGVKATAWLCEIRGGGEARGENGYMQSPAAGGVISMAACGCQCNLAVSVSL